MDGYQAVVIGGSAGAISALGVILPGIASPYALPLVIAIHLHPQQDRYFLQHFGERCALPVKEAEEKEPVLPGTVYFAPPNYHLLIEDDRTFSLSIDARVNFARPSIDVLFESAADAYGPGLIGVCLTGANDDGAQGLRRIKARGGRTVVQDPHSAESPFMPRAALEAAQVDHVLPLVGIAELLQELGQQAGRASAVLAEKATVKSSNAPRKDW